jgi:hypothetical protein
LAAQVATFDTVHTVLFTTDVHVSITFVATFPTTFVAVETVPCTTAVPDSTTQLPEVAHAIIFHIPSLRSVQTQTIP